MYSQSLGDINKIVKAGILTSSRKNITQAASSDNYWNIYAPLKPGYTRIVVDVSFSGTNCSFMMKYYDIPATNQDTVTVYCRNWASSSFVGTIKVTVFYILDELITDVVK